VEANLKLEPSDAFHKVKEGVGRVSFLGKLSYRFGRGVGFCGTRIRYKRRRCISSIVPVPCGEDRT
jgi:hypothetical protein